jgi:histidinol dehydrogenase
VQRISGERDVHRSRHALNADTIREMHLAFRRGGRKAIEKVMRNQPAVFLKLLVLLVPREHKVEHSNPIKDMTDEQLEQAIEFIEKMLAAQAENTKVIEGTKTPTALPAPTELEQPHRKRSNRLLEHVDTAIGPRGNRKPQ